METLPIAQHQMSWAFDTSRYDTVITFMRNVYGNFNDVRYYHRKRIKIAE